MLTIILSKLIPHFKKKAELYLRDVRNKLKYGEGHQ